MFQLLLDAAYSDEPGAIWICRRLFTNFLCLMKRAGLDKAADDYQKSTIGRQNRRRKRQRAFALKRIRQTECHPQAYADMCLHAAHAVCCKFVSLLHPQEMGFLVFFPSFSGLLMMSCTNPKSLNGFLLWVVEGDAIESNGFLFVGVGVGVVQLMQLSQHM